jgi:hypothetical protein
MGYVVVAAVAFVFGAVDQYLGGLWSSTHVGFWTTDVSAMSAPWLALPFLVGTRQRNGSSAGWSGAIATLSALLGYFVMTLSPIEGVAIRQIHPLAFAISQLHVILPALITGPLWGWFGHRWRRGRSWPIAALVAGAFCLEPLARTVYGQPFMYAGAAAAEVITGVLLMGWLVLSARQGPDAGTAR